LKHPVNKGSKSAELAIDTASVHIIAGSDCVVDKFKLLSALKMPPRTGPSV